MCTCSKRVNVIIDRGYDREIGGWESVSWVGCGYRGKDGWAVLLRCPDCGQLWEGGPHIKDEWALAKVESFREANWLSNMATKYHGYLESGKLEDSVNSVVDNFQRRGFKVHKGYWPGDSPSKAWLCKIVSEKKSFWAKETQVSTAYIDERGDVRWIKGGAY